MSCVVHEVLTPTPPCKLHTVWVWRVSQGGVRVCTSGAKTKELSAVSFECERVWGLGGTRPIRDTITKCCVVSQTQKHTENTQL